MKLVVFAHTPPPAHGQSYMVQLMLEGFGGNRRSGPQPANGRDYGMECYHVNARISKNLADIGGVRPGKLALLLWHCLQAIWCRFRYGAPTLYYVPAPGKAAALGRDWLVMGICRPFFKRVIYHWHATSLSRWLETCTPRLTRNITFRLMGRADLSIVLSSFNRYAAEKIWPQRIAVVANGIPDPCADFAQRVLPRRQARLDARKKLVAGRTLEGRERDAAGANPETLRVLFLAHCTREKGLFDAVQGVLLANARLRQRRCPLRVQLTVAGTFPVQEERIEFDRLCQADPEGGAIHHVGYIHGPQKTDALLEADVLCFPSHWENQPVSVIEALAFGLPVAITRLPSVQEMLPAGYRAVANLACPEQLAEALLSLVEYGNFTELRRHFTEKFAVEAFYSRLADALRRVEDSAPSSQ